MKKFLIHFMSADTPSIEDDGIGCGVNGGILMEEGSKKIKLFDSKEEAQKYLDEVMIPEDQANLEDCYGITDEPNLADNYEFSVENGTWDRKELAVYDTFDGRELNTTIYEVVEVEF